MQRRAFLASVTGSALGLASREATAVDPRLLSEAQCRWVASNRVVRFTVGSLARPFLYIDAARPRGIAIDMLARAAEMTGLEFAFVESPSKSEALRSLAEGEVSLVPYMRVDESRARIYAFTRPMARVTQGVFSRLDSPYIDSLTDLNALRVGIPEGTLEKFGAARQGPEYVEFRTVGMLVRALRDRQVEAIVGPIPTIQEELQRHGMAATATLQTVLSTKVPYAMACSAAAAPLAAILDRVLDRILVAERRTMAERHAKLPEPRATLAIGEVGPVGGVTALALGLTAVGAGWWLGRESAFRARSMGSQRPGAQGDVSVVGVD